MKPTAYDRVPYKSAAVYHAHPNRLAALAMLFGMKPADIRNCRILELGCGEGTNLISIAYGLPQSELTGIDMAGSAVARGQKMIRELELKNITLLHRDISEPWPETEKFDYIIAHGVFSWVPQAVQEKILSLCKNNLSEQGIAYISYNAYPGWHLSEISRNIMRFHTDRFPDPNRKAVQALAILKFVTESCLSKSGAYAQALSDELDIIGKTSPDMYHNRLIHDRLSEVNTPMYFSDFIGKAEAHGLNYLAEADFSEMNDLYFPQAVREMLLRISGDDILVKEQLADFLKGRKFRRTLLCHAEVSLNRNLHSNFMENFFFSCPAKPEDENGQILKLPFSELLARKNTGLSRDGSVLNTDNTAVRAALFHLSDIYPAALHFRELLELGQKYGTLSPGEGSAALCEALMSGFSGSLIELYAYPRNFAREPGDYPVASRLARLQVRTGSKVTNLCHQTLELENTYGLFLLPLLDGTRSRRTIEEESLNIIRSGNIALNGKFPYEKTEGELIAEINEELINCAKFGLLSE